MDRKEIVGILAAAGLRPQRQFGQNFMVDRAALHAIADAGEIGEQDVILEVGPGVGNLTRLLAQRAFKGHVLAVDIDRKLMPAAQQHHAALRNITWLNADVLAGKHEVQPRVLERLRELCRAHPQGALKLVSNLPYNAASPLVAELLVAMWKDLRHPRDAEALLLARMAFTVQWEVGLRMAAAPNTRDYGPLGILMQAMASVEIVRKIPPGAFWPPPKIHSALVVVTPLPERMNTIRDAVALQKFLAGIFGHRRQTLGNALRHFFGDAWKPQWKKELSQAGFDLMQRPENFSVESLRDLEARTHLLTSQGC